MTDFAYIARDAAGQRVTGRVAAASEQAVVADLQSRQLAPVQVRPVHGPTLQRSRVPVRHLATGYRQLADLLRAGVPLLRALRILANSKASPRLASVMTSIAQAVADGQRLADAMAVHEPVFPPVQIAMVRAGERGGFLEPVLARIGDFLERRADMRAKVAGNLIYPCILLFVGLTIIIAALVFFVPKFEKYFAGIELPVTTKVLLALSALVTHHWPTLLVLCMVLIGAAIYFKRQPAVRRAIAVWQLRVPLLGELIRTLAVARFARILGTLLTNGVPLLGAMQISRDAAGHSMLERAIDQAGEAVRAGESLSKPLSQSGLFGEDVVEMISVGESANNLASVLLTVAESLESRIDRMLTLFVRLMEPLLLLLLAAMVAFIFLALVIPMMRLSTGVS